MRIDDEDDDEILNDAVHVAYVLGVLVVVIIVIIFFVL